MAFGRNAGVTLNCLHHILSPIDGEPEPGKLHCTRPLGFQVQDTLDGRIDWCPR